MFVYSAGQNRLCLISQQASVATASVGDTYREKNRFILYMGCAMFHPSLWFRLNKSFALVLLSAEIHKK